MTDQHADWSLLQPGDQAVYMPCQDDHCPDPAPDHMHFDHVVHQESDSPISISDEPGE